MPIDYPFADQRPAPGEFLEIAPGLRWLRMPLPFALDHINLWLIRDGDGWAAVDTGVSTNAIREAWSTILPQHPLRRILVTHFHPDHLGNAAWLQEKTGAPLWISQGEYQYSRLVAEQASGYSVEDMLRFFRRHGLGEAMLQALAERGNAYKRGVPSVPQSFRRLRGDDVVDFGGCHWRIIAGFGHSPEHASLPCPARGVLISGDMLLPRISTNIPVMSQTPDDDPLGDFLCSIDAFTTLPEDTLVLPSHGLPFRGIKDRVAALHAHHEDRCRVVEVECATPRTAAELIPVIFERPITDAHQCMFAMGESMAHLNYLERRGRLRRLEENGTIRYVKS